MRQFQRLTTLQWQEQFRLQNDENNGNENTVLSNLVKDILRNSFWNQPLVGVNETSRCFRSFSLFTVLRYFWVVVATTFSWHLCLKCKQIILKVVPHSCHCTIYDLFSFPWLYCSIYCIAPDFDGLITLINHLRFGSGDSLTSKLGKRVGMSILWLCRPNSEEKPNGNKEVPQCALS